MRDLVGVVEDPRDLSRHGLAVVDRRAFAALAFQHDPQNGKTARSGCLDSQQPATLFRGGATNLFRRHLAQFHRTKKRAAARSVNTRQIGFLSKWTGERNSPVWGHRALRMETWP